MKHKETYEHRADAATDVSAATIENCVTSLLAHCDDSKFGRVEPSHEKGGVLTPLLLPSDPAGEPRHITKGRSKVRKEIAYATD
eukprot:1006267-Amphidinium_carterae.1